MIIFKDLHIIGFGSIEELTYDFSKKGINVILGPNGSGKTTIFSALSWCLYRQLLKDNSTVQPWPEIVKKENYQGTKVSIKFQKGKHDYEIIRCQDYKLDVNGEKGKDRLILLTDDKMRADLRDKKDIQTEIENILGYSFNLFKNSILFGQSLTRIIKETGPNKKALFDEAFEVGFINEAKKNCDAEKAQLHAEFVSYTNKIFTLKEKLKNLIGIRNREKELLENWDKSKADRVFNLHNKLEELCTKLQGKDNDDSVILSHKQEISKLQEKLNLFAPIKKEQKEISDYLFKASLDKAKLEGEIRDLLQKLKGLIAITTKPIDKCPRCQQNLNKEKAQIEKTQLLKEIEEGKTHGVKLRTQLAAINIGFEAHEKKLSSINKKLEQELHINLELKKLEKRLNELNIEKSNRSIYKVQLSELQTSLEVVKNEKPDFKIKLIQAKRDIKEIKTELVPIKEQYKKVKKEYELIQWLIDDPLSNKGIKAYVFSTMLELVNKNLEKYFMDLGFTINFGIDLESARKDFSTSIFKDGHEKFYGELSGGQQQMIDVAIAFAIHDTVSLTKDCNILIMDEVFESLDRTNIEKVIDLTRIKAKSLAIHIITHREEFSINTTNSMRLNLIDGITTLV